MAPSPPASGPSSNRSTRSCSRATTTTSSCSAERCRNGPGWYRVGLALHVQNGALFGAVYANVAPALPIAPTLRGPVLALAEHLAGWPLVALTDRYHPARNDLPALSGNRRAFVQATWRHLLFGLVLGELERRLNPPVEPEPPAPAPNYASNGHGSLERAVSAVQD